MMKYSIKVDNLNLYVCSITLGLLEYMIHSRDFSLEIWSLGMPIFHDDLKKQGIDNRLIKIVQIFDEFSAMEKLDMDVDSIIKEKITIVKEIMDELQRYNLNNHIRIEKSE